MVVFQSLCESDLELRLREAIRQRDEQWRKHEREQIVFLQNETAAMLRGLHKEIERLGYQLKGKSVYRKRGREEASDEVGITAQTFLPLQTDGFYTLSSLKRAGRHSLRVTKCETNI